MATHSSVPAWRIPWTEEPGGPRSTGSRSRRRLKQLGRNRTTSRRGRRGIAFSALLSGGQDGAAAQKAVWQFLITLPLTLLPFLGIYPRETKIYFHTKTGTQMFYSRSVHYQQKLKEPQCPPVEEWGMAIHPYNRILPGSGEQQATHARRTPDETQ